MSSMWAPWTLLSGMLVNESPDAMLFPGLWKPLGFLEVTSNYLDMQVPRASVKHHGIVTWKHSPHYWPFVRGIHLSCIVSPPKGPLMQGCDALLARTSCWTNVYNWVDGNLRSLMWGQCTGKLDIYRNRNINRDHNQSILRWMSHLDITPSLRILGKKNWKLAVESCIGF